MNKFILIIVLVLAPIVSYGADVVEIQFVSVGFNDAGHKIRGDTIRPQGDFVIRGTQTPVVFVRSAVPVRGTVFIQQHLPVFHPHNFIITQQIITPSAVFITQEWRTGY